MKNEIENFDEKLSRFTKVKYNIPVILSSQSASYNKTGIGYQLDNSFILIFLSKKNKNCSNYNCNFYHKHGHLESLCFSKTHDLRWSKWYDSRHLKSTNAIGSQKIWIPNVKNLIYFEGMICDFKGQNAN